MLLVFNRSLIISEILLYRTARAVNLALWDREKFVYALAEGRSPSVRIRLGGKGVHRLDIAVPSLEVVEAIVFHRKFNPTFVLDRSKKVIRLLHRHKMFVCNLEHSGACILVSGA